MAKYLRGGIQVHKSSTFWSETQPRTSINVESLNLTAVPICTMLSCIKLGTAVRLRLSTLIIDYYLIFLADFRHVLPVKISETAFDDLTTRTRLTPHLHNIKSFVRKVSILVCQNAKESLTVFRKAFFLCFNVLSKFSNVFLVYLGRVNIR